MFTESMIWILTMAKQIPHKDFPRMVFFGLHVIRGGVTDLVTKPSVLLWIAHLTCAMVKRPSCFGLVGTIIKAFMEFWTANEYLSVCLFLRVPFGLVEREGKYNPHFVSDPNPYVDTSRDLSDDPTGRVESSEVLGVFAITCVPLLCFARPGERA